MKEDLTSYRTFYGGERIPQKQLPQYLLFKNKDVVLDEELFVLNYARTNMQKELITYFYDNLGCQPNITQKELYKEIREWGVSLV